MAKSNVDDSNRSKPNIGGVVTTIVALIIIVGFLIFVMMNDASQQHQPSSSPGYTNLPPSPLPQVYTNTLFSNGQVFSINPGYYEVVNFSIPQGAYSINITGSYTSQGKVEVAILTPAQYGAFTQNPSSITSSQYYYGYSQGATINTVLTAGQYSLVFYDPGIITQDTITVINPIIARYTEEQ